MQKMLNNNQIVIPNDKETLKILYGQKKPRNPSLDNMRGRNFSPSQKFLLESISSLDRLQDSVLISPPINQSRCEHSISPELISDSQRFFTEQDDVSQENSRSQYLKPASQPPSALSKFYNSRLHGLSKSRSKSRKSFGSHRNGIPTYFKDAAELLKSRILKQIK